MLNDKLKTLGLSEKEINVYVKLLEIGTQPASIIGSRLDMSRNTVRFTLDKLANQGFVEKAYDKDKLFAFLRGDGLDKDKLMV